MDNWLDKMTQDRGEYEIRMEAEHKCITCGCSIERRGPRKDGTWIYPRHCLDCAKLRYLPDERNLGPARASIHHELARRTGYSSAQPGGPEMNTTTEET
jgi:hypothetical protein